jgi:cytoskeletal protein RodZ
MAQTRYSPSSNGHDQSAKQSHHVAVAVIVLVIVAVFVLLSAFVWPGWATGSSSQKVVPSTSKKTVSTPSIAAVPLASNASELLKAMPGTVDNYARQGVAQGTLWNGAKPIEEYAITYSVKADDAVEDITLEVAQWATADDANAQYSASASSMGGDQIAGGKVKVSGKDTGVYQVCKDPANDKVAIALWQNDTVVFQATGPTSAIESFYKDFPL